MTLYWRIPSQISLDVLMAFMWFTRVFKFRLQLKWHISPLNNIWRLHHSSHKDAELSYFRCQCNIFLWDLCHFWTPLTLSTLSSSPLEFDSETAAGHHGKCLLKSVSVLPSSWPAAKGLKMCEFLTGPDREGRTFTAWRPDADLMKVHKEAKNNSVLLEY